MRRKKRQPTERQRVAAIEKARKALVRAINDYQQDGFGRVNTLEYGAQSENECYIQIAVDTPRMWLGWRESD